MIQYTHKPLALQAIEGVGRVKGVRARVCVGTREEKGTQRT
jgi:hypothetical protein